MAAVGNRIDAIEHVGSTAIPGMWAKPVIDIAVAIPELELAETLVSGMATIGYDYPGDIGLPNQRIFGRAPQILTHLVHVVTTNGDECLMDRLFGTESEDWHGVSGYAAKRHCSSHARPY